MDEIKSLAEKILILDGRTTSVIDRNDVERLDNIPGVSPFTASVIMA